MTIINPGLQQDLLVASDENLYHVNDYNDGGKEYVSSDDDW